MVHYLVSGLVYRILISKQCIHRSFYFVQSFDANYSRRTVAANNVKDGLLDYDSSASIGNEK